VNWWQILFWHILLRNVVIVNKLISMDVEITALSDNWPCFLEPLGPKHHAARSCSPDHHSPHWGCPITSSTAAAWFGMASLINIAESSSIPPTSVPLYTNTSSEFRWPGITHPLGLHTAPASHDEASEKRHQNIHLDLKNQFKQLQLYVQCSKPVQNKCNSSNINYNLNLITRLSTVLLQT